MVQGMVVGVHAHAEPERLVQTIWSLRAGGAGDASVVLLPDGPDPELTAALAADPALAALPQWGTAAPLGAAACFNRLASGTDAAVVILIESGTVLGPGCLTLLTEALGRPEHGLAGPSTNRSWNEQAVFGGASQSDVARMAALAGRRLGHAARPLEPLHSLADFCLAVRREVIETIGGADEEYGLGPCWEMDYNIRAARAGFRGVWVGSAYAYRNPPTERRRVAEARQMGRSRRLYQDRFCGLRLERLRVDYEDHCRGEACEYFAPAELITVRRPLAAADGLGPARPQPLAPTRPQPLAPTRPAGSRAAVTSPVARPSPLITAIMPTRQRPDFARQAARYFLAQDYPARELLVLEDGEPSLAGRLPEDPRIRYVATGAAARSIGAMRNEACGLARGDIVAHWDDDDWYGPQRLSRQAAAIVAGTADITALRDSLMLDLPAWRFWRCRPDLHRRLFVRDVHGGTLVYRRQVWAEKARFPDCSLAEDAAFLDQAVRRGARLQSVDATGIFVYVRHGANAWGLVCGVTGGAAGWEARPEPDLPPAEREFYAARSPAAPARDGRAQGGEAQGGEALLVSCIMPTYGRRAFVPQAVRYFLRQDYPAKELIVVDDGPEPVSDLLPADDRIVYRRLETRTILGTKRNLACQLARGPVIAHWDDDDWASPGRLTVQVATLTGSGADICGTASLLYYAPASGQAWRFTWPSGLRPWAAGPSLCFARDLWARSPFPEAAIGEDTRFVFSPAVRRIADVSAAECVIGIIHDGNTAPKTVSGAYWTPRPGREAEDLLGPDMTFYRSLGNPAGKDFSDVGAGHPLPEECPRLRPLLGANHVGNFLSRGGSDASRARPITSERGVVAVGPGVTASGAQALQVTACSQVPRLTLLGGFSLCVGRDIIPLSHAPQRLLALLALHGGELRRGYVAGLLWGDSTEARASGCLRSALWKLRGVGLRVITTHGDSLALSRDVDTDIEHVTNLARSVVAGGIGEETFALLDPCFSGELLPGWHDEWVVDARERHRQLSLYALELLCEHLTGIGRYGAAVLAGMAAVNREPLRESAHRTLMKVHLAEGNAGEAIRQYRQYEAIAARDLGVGPSARMRLLLSEIATTDN
jgi:DNA-binding SARP family transcriptional activator/glycosyltransferase involved in cell wall biosynthesis